MAEVNNRDGPSKKGKTPRTRKKSTKIDMTAMVDVAFLLLTFFVLTATLSNQYVMEVVKPPKCEGDDCFKKIIDSKILTLILDENDVVSYYHGTGTAGIDKTDYSSQGVRQVILDHLNARPDRCPDKVTTDCWDPIVVIKPKKTSRYKNLVDVLDEMEITGATKYAVADFTREDSLFLVQQKLFGTSEIVR